MIAKGIIVFGELGVSSRFHQHLPYVDVSLKIGFPSSFLVVFEDISSIPLTTSLDA